MIEKKDLEEMDRIIVEARENIEKLMQTSGGMQCVDRNCERILAGIKMLELNISDVQDVL